MYSLEEMLSKLDNLNSSDKPLWGKMTAQHMVEHLSNSFKMASGKLTFPSEVQETVFERMQAFLMSEKPMAKNIQVAFAPENEPLRHEELELAIDEFAEEWINFLEEFEGNLAKTTPHPYYGELSFELWNRLHKKHVQHHFEQFGLL